MNKRLIADRADILKNGYEDLFDVINDSSEDAVKEDFFSVIKKNFPAKKPKSPHKWQTRSLSVGKDATIYANRNFSIYHGYSHGLRADIL